MGILTRKSLGVTVAVLMSVTLLPTRDLSRSELWRNSALRDLGRELATQRWLSIGLVTQRAVAGLCLTGLRERTRHTALVDEDPLQDFCITDLKIGLTINGLTCKPADEGFVNDFTFAGLKNAGYTINANKAAVTPATVLQIPGLNTLGISAARIDFAKGGINPPHTHPRATEILLVVKGELYVGFVSTSNTLFATCLKEGELFVFPKGLVHFQLNLGKGPALAFAALSSQNPGVQQTAPALFTSDIKDEVLEKALRINEQTLDMIQKQLRL